MEIHHLPPNTVQPLRPPSKTEDGDSSSSGNFYRRSKKQAPQEKTQDGKDKVPKLEGSSKIIDIRV